MMAERTVEKKVGLKVVKLAGMTVAYLAARMAVRMAEWKVVRKADLTADLMVGGWVE